MKHFIYSCLVLIFFSSCQQKITENDIQLLNGYWEIEKVELPDAEDKDYATNDTYDFFEIKNNQGFRVKVIPQLDGKLLTNQIKEEVKITFLDGKVFLNYKTRYATWKEEIIQLTKEKFVVKNSNDIEYYYKKVNNPLE